jgi:two-component system sensor histidine kinase UhpB
MPGVFPGEVFPKTEISLTEDEAMRGLRTGSEPSNVPRESAWRDTALVVGITALSIVLSIHFDLNEWLYALTRHWERFQVDELPIGMLVLSICLMWLSWRRYEHARRELNARRIAERRLGEVLVENRELAQENLRIQEAERKHLARELHDELGQYLNAIKLDAVSICESRGMDASLSTNAAGSIIRTVDHVHGAVSDMIARLRPVGLDELGLVAAIEHCVDYWRQRLPDTRFALSVSGNFENLGETLNLTMYRLIQEGLTNIYKHAHARQAEIALERVNASPGGADELRLTLADDGRGMQPSTRTSRFGLSGMRERVEMEGGTFVLDSAPGHGLRLEVHLPANGNHHA